MKMPWPIRTCATLRLGILFIIVGDKTIAVLGGKSGKDILGEEGFVTQDS